jgi:hypothetical protein
MSDAAMDHIVKWCRRVGLAWCVAGLLAWAWRGSLFWVGWYLLWLGLTVWSHRRMRRSRDEYLIAEARLQYERDRLEGEL